jgi:hypothetical protein
MPEDHEHLQLGTATIGLELDAPVYLTRADLRRHLYIVGKTGTGKSTLLYILMRADLESGRGFALLDPHGDLAIAVADATPAWRIAQGVIYLDPSDLGHPVSFNPLSGVAPDRRPLVAAHVVAAFQHIWGASWGPRLEYILSNALRLLLDAPGSTLLGLPKLLADEGYRGCLLAHARDPMVRNFWQAEFAQYSERFASEAIAPIQNKIGALLSPPAIRNMLGQVKSAIDVRAIMDRGQVLIVNLSKGKLGEAPRICSGRFWRRRLRRPRRPAPMWASWIAATSLCLPTNSSILRRIASHPSSRRPANTVWRWSWRTSFSVSFPICCGRP